MAIEAPLSRYRRNSLIFMIVVAVGGGLWFAYDGYLSETFIQKHKDAETGEPDFDLKVNRAAPPYMFLAAVLIAGYWALIRHRKIVATETELVISKRLIIPYAAIQSIDKTHFSDRGYFDILYQRPDGSEAKTRIDDRKFDKLQPLLDHLIAQIT